MHYRSYCHSINNSDTNEYTKFSSSDYKKFETYVTDESRDLEKYQSGNTNVAVSIPAKSVTRLVMMKYGIKDIRDLNSGSLKTLSQFTDDEN